MYIMEDCDSRIFARNTSSFERLQNSDVSRTSDTSHKTRDISFSIENILKERKGSTSIRCRSPVPIAPPTSGGFEQYRDEYVDVTSSEELDDVTQSECAEADGGGNSSDNNYAWLQCSRYKPPKLPSKLL